MEERPVREWKPWVLGVWAVWGLCVVVALPLVGQSSAAGRIEGRVVGLVMVGGMGFAALTMAAAWHLPERIPLLLRRLLGVAGMGGAIWSVSTIFRALYSVF